MQVLIPDVQKLINQLGAVNTDLFACRHVRPPTSVLLLPLRASGVGIYGALYCLSDVQVGATQGRFCFLISAAKLCALGPEASGLWASTEP